MCRVILWPPGAQATFLLSANNAGSDEVVYIHLGSSPQSLCKLSCDFKRIIARGLMVLQVSPLRFHTIH